LLHAVEREAVEGFAFGQADLLQALAQIVFLDVLVAAQVQFGDRGTLHHLDHQDVALALHFHVTEELGLVQRTDRTLRSFVGQSFALVDRQVVEDGPGRDAAKPVDTNIGNDERLERERIGRECGKQDQSGDTLHRRFRWVIPTKRAQGPLR